MKLEELGFTKEELQEHVVSRICSELLHSEGTDEDGNPTGYPSRMQQALRDEIRKRITDSVTALGDELISGNIESFIDALTLQETNKWGEAKGAKVTFREYLVARAELYMQETVNYEGKNKEEAGSYSWTGTQTRLTHIIHRHLQYSIEGAMKKAVAGIQGSISDALAETCKIKLAEIAANLKVQVTTTVKD